MIRVSGLLPVQQELTGLALSVPVELEGVRRFEDQLIGETICCIFSHLLLLHNHLNVGTRETAVDIAESCIQLEHVVGRPKVHATLSLSLKSHKRSSFMSIFSG